MPAKAGSLDFWNVEWTWQYGSMIKMTISLDVNTKRWLDQQARQAGIPVSQLVCEAIESMRRNAVPESPPVDFLLKKTAGMWKGQRKRKYLVRLFGKIEYDPAYDYKSARRGPA